MMNRVGCGIGAVTLVVLMTAQVQGAEVDSLVSGNNAFAFDLYGRLAQTDGNVFFSPYSISTALAMTYAGARTVTEEEMARVLRFDRNQDRFHSDFSDLQKRIHTSMTHEAVSIDVANSIWCQEGYEFLPEFLSVQSRFYNAQPNLVEFITQPEQARRKINQWVAEKTHGKVRDLIPPGLISRLTVMVLCNAVYFNASWEIRFDEEKTTDEAFAISPDKTVIVPMMRMSSSVRYHQYDGFSMLELPYANGSTSMILLLPDRTTTLGQLHDRISWPNMGIWLDLLDTTGTETVNVKMPRFSMTERFDLADTLASMGMPHAFRRADFSGMTGTRELFISDVVHKAFIDVSEEGTEAAAATAVIMKRGGGTPSFIADRPFFFLIRDAGTGSILFMGRMMDPTAKSGE